jgi:pimeloyl-ACP methyl ester carboxylesterase
MDLPSNGIPSLPPGSVRGATLTSTASGLKPKINLNLRPFSTATEESKSNGKANNNAKDSKQIKTNNFNNINETINETDNDNESVDNYPLIFFHGISPGLCCYLPFLMNICKDRASIFIEIPHVTTMLNFTPHQHSTMAYAVEHILDRHHIKEAAVMGHSFGSIVAKVIACSNENIKQLILVDPVCLLLCLPDVAYNFLYWEPISRFAKFAYHHLGLRGEITISNALRRHFWWYENILWLEDLPCDLIVALPEFDGIIPVDAIKEYLESFKLDKVGKGGKKEAPNQQPFLEMRRSMSLSIDELPVYENDIRLIVWRNYFHGRVLFEESGQQELLDEMREQQLVIHKRENAMALQGDLDNSLSRRQSLVRANTYQRAPSYSRNISFF